MNDQQKFDKFSPEFLKATVASILRKVPSDAENYSEQNYDYTQEFSNRFSQQLHEMCRFCIERKIPFTFMLFPFATKNDEAQAGFHIGAAGAWRERGQSLRHMLPVAACKADSEADIEEFIIDMARMVKIKRMIDEVDGEMKASRKNKATEVVTDDDDALTKAQEIIDRMMQKK